MMSSHIIQCGFFLQVCMNYPVTGVAKYTAWQSYFHCKVALIKRKDSLWHGDHNWL